MKKAAVPSVVVVVVLLALGVYSARRSSQESCRRLDFSHPVPLHALGVRRSSGSSKNSVMSMART